MFVIYAVVLAWAALSNALGGSTGWIVFALFQLYLSVRVLQRFFRYRKAQGEIAAVLGQDSPHVPDRAARVFPWMGCILGAFSFAGTIAVIVVIFAYVFAEESNVPQVLDLMMESMVNVGLLAVAVGLASLLSRFRYKGLSILGMVGGLVVLGGVLLLALT